MTMARLLSAMVLLAVVVATPATAQDTEPGATPLPLGLTLVEVSAVVPASPDPQPVSFVIDLEAGPVGRTDLPGGDFRVLEKSIRERIYTLPDDTVVVPGHGPDTTVGREKATNPFVSGEG